MTGAEDIMLYWASGSPFCMRVMITLEEKKLHGYGNTLLTMNKDEHKQPHIAALNPRTQVPTFRHGTIVVNESMAICDYLEFRFKNQGTALLPDDPKEYALVKQRQYEVNNLVKKLVPDLIFYMFSDKVDQTLLKDKKLKVANELAIWDGYLKHEGEGAYLAGKKFTMADVAAYPFLALSVRFGMKFRPRMPFLASYYERVSERPSVKTSWPPHWQTNPPKDMLHDVLD